MDRTRARCPDIPNLPHYLTAGKVYEFRPHHAAGWFVFMDDKGVDRTDTLTSSKRLNGADWENPSVCSPSPDTDKS